MCGVKHTNSCRDGMDVNRWFPLVAFHGMRMKLMPCPLGRAPQPQIPTK